MQFEGLENKMSSVVAATFAADKDLARQINGGDMAVAAATAHSSRLRPRPEERRGTNWRRFNFKV